MSSASWRAPTLRDLFVLAWPVVVGRAAQSVVGFADAAMVAPLGPDALAAVGNGALNALAVMMLPMGVVTIVSSYASQLHDSVDRARLRRYGWYGLGLAAATELLGLVCLPLVAWLLGRAAYAPMVRALMTEYLVIRLVGAGAAVGLEALSHWFAGQGDTRLGLRANLLVMLLNVPLNAMLIRGAWGFAPMGVRGAALASVIATAVGFGYALWRFVGVGRGVSACGWRWSEVQRMLRFGLPNGVNWFLEFGAFLFFVDVVFAGMGTAALAALMAVLQLNTVAFMPAFGLSSAGAIHVGQAIGDDAKHAVPGLVRRAAAVACAWMGLVGLGYALAPRWLLVPFAPVEPVARAAFLAVAVPLLWVAVGWQLFDATAMALGEALRAAGDTAWPMRARIVLAWGFFVPATLLAARAGAGPTLTLGLVVLYMGALAAMLVWRFRGGAWRTMALTAEET